MWTQYYDSPAIISFLSRLEVKTYDSVIIYKRLYISDIYCKEARSFCKRVVTLNDVPISQLFLSNK